MNTPRHVIVDDQVSKFWSINVKCTFQLGLLIGQLSVSTFEDFVLAVVPIPSESESNEAPIELGDVSIDWVQNVAQQIDRLLPGGITVLGLYVTSTADVSTEITPFLCAVAEAITLPSHLIAGDDVHYVAFVSPKGDIAFQSFYDVTDAKKLQIRLAEHEAPTAGIKFKQYRTLIDLEEPIPFASVLSSADIIATTLAERRMNEMKNSLKSLFRRVEDSSAVHKPMDDTDVQYMKLLTLSPLKSKTLVNDPHGKIQGTISCVAFVSLSEPETNEVAAKYLKRDFIKSVLVRVSLARERWVENDEVKPNAVFIKGGVIPLAQRGHVQWRAANVSSPHFFGTVHIFSDENAVQAVKNALEILGDDTTSDGTPWVAMEIGGQLNSSMDLLTMDVSKSKQWEYANYLLPLVMILIVFVVQNYM